MILAGGTGGHIFPGLAVARVLRARQVPVLWLGSVGGMETRLVPANDFPIEVIAVRGLRGKDWLTKFAAPFWLLRSLWQALAVLRRQRPRAVISFGGFAAGPGGLAAWLLRRPLIVHEQNRAPGMTNRLLAHLAKRVLCGFPETFRAVETETIGNPVRAEIAAIPPPAQRFLGRSGQVRLLVLGGSLGAYTLNVVLPQVLAQLPRELRPVVRHQCGERHIQKSQRVYKASQVDASIEPFIVDMAQAYAWADFVICRAGALTLAELCAAGVGALLVPFTQAVDDHQTRNAEYLVERGAAQLVPEGEQFRERLLAAITPLLSNAELRLAMAQAARAIAIPNAAERVADIVIEEAHA